MRSEKIQIKFTPKNNELVQLKSLVGILSAIQNEYKTAIVKSNEFNSSEEKALRVLNLKNGSFIGELVTLSQMVFPSVAFSSLDIFIKHFINSITILSDESFKPNLDLPMQQTNCQNFIDLSNSCIENNGVININYYNKNDEKDSKNEIVIDQPKAKIIRNNSKKQKEILQNKQGENFYEKVIFNWSATDFDDTKHDYGTVAMIADDRHKIIFKSTSVKEKLLNKQGCDWPKDSYYVDIQVYTKNKKIAYYEITKIYDKSP
ncbi:MAG: hypothetical protein P8I61_03005 [Opitutae bacterium]|nr:hypothetical protein [Opitutae bacterium]